MKLLPHSFNIAATLWLVVWIIARCTLPVFIHGVPDWPTWIIIINIIAIGVACFSAEKVEDEMINSLRLSSIAIIAGSYLILFLVEALLRVVGISGKFLGDFLSMMSEETDIWFLFYILLLKIRIFAASRRMSND